MQHANTFFCAVPWETKHSTQKENRLAIHLMKVIVTEKLYVRTTL